MATAMPVRRSKPTDARAPRMPARKPRNGLSSRLTCLIALPSAPKTS